MYICKEILVKMYYLQLGFTCSVIIFKIFLYGLFKKEKKKKDI